ncbi:thioesterase II family protein [Streptomyces sp. NBC_01244]|uniref:thioesterase II family protein n=1 Tax=Streptomyces sp. NBC_01244 TaxID=2903797 RepID=UPI002E0DC8A1|nr:alpha/beta fold hydrolase [Streptomyces sp. NBC_01244]
MLSIICCPFAGAGTAFFRPWRRLAVPGIEVVPVLLPGRERLIEAAPVHEVAEAVRFVLAETAERVAGTRVAVFGHSSGGVLAYALARALLAETGTEVVRLFVSGARGPEVPPPHRATGLPAADFLARVEDFAGYRHPALADPEMRKLILPTLRADVEMYENYRHDPAERISVPITAIRGTDDELVSATDVLGWAAATSEGFDSVELPGGHMYLTEQAPDLLRLLLASTAPAATRENR